MTKKCQCAYTDCDEPVSDWTDPLCIECDAANCPIRESVND